MKYRVGTRKSKLSTTQTEEVVKQLEKRSDSEFEIIDLQTLGDTEKWRSIKDIDEVGVFTRELDRALVQGEIDFAVHSSKDVPTDLPSEIRVGAVTERLGPEDVLVGAELEDLKAGAKIGTGSPRRKEQLLQQRSDIEVVPIRGNVETRLEKVGEEVDAVVLAKAGLQRLGVTDKIDQVLPLKDFLPAPGQAALTVTCREEDEKTLELLNIIDHAESRYAITAEKAVLNEIGRGCSVPLGTLARIEGEEIVLEAEHSGEGVRVVVEGDIDEAAAVGSTAAKKMIEKIGGV